MKLPRDVSGRALAKALAKLGYRKVSQRGSHMRLETTERGRDRVIVTDEKVIPPGTLHDTLKHIAAHFETTVNELLEQLDL